MVIIITRIQSMDAFSLRFDKRIIPLFRFSSIFENWEDLRQSHVIS